MHFEVRDHIGTEIMGGYMKRPDDQPITTAEAMRSAIEEWAAQEQQLKVFNDGAWSKVYTNSTVEWLLEQLKVFNDGAWSKVLY